MDRNITIFHFPADEWSRNNIHLAINIETKMPHKFEMVSRLLTTWNVWYCTVEVIELRRKLE